MNKMFLSMAVLPNENEKQQIIEEEVKCSFGNEMRKNVVQQVHRSLQTYRGYVHDFSLTSVEKRVDGEQRQIIQPFRIVWFMKHGSNRIASILYAMSAFSLCAVGVWGNSMN